MIRTHRSEDYNWNFDTETGYFQRWGKTLDDDPTFSPLGPEILDLEISTICSEGHRNCKNCYKSNTTEGKFMPISKLETILDILPSNITQIAYGIGDKNSHPQLEQVFHKTVEAGIVPNITINGRNYSNDSEACETLAKYCGSVAVSHYSEEQCFSTIETLTSLGMKQVNIHQIVSYDSYQDCLDLIEKSKTDLRLKKLNAIVFLMLKPKGRAVGQRPATFEQFKSIVDKAMTGKVSIGFDSCSAPSFLKAIKYRPDFESISKYIEPCEAFLFSSYCNVDGEFFPCSFCEGELGWEKGIAIDNNTDFIKDVWNHPRMLGWRKRLISSSQNCVCNLKSMCRSCPIYSETKLCI
jgi:hypothetical protein